MAETERLIVELEARVDKFEKAMTKAAADLDKVAQSSERVESATTKSGKAIASAFREAAKGTSEFERNIHNATSNVIPFRRSVEAATKAAQQTGYQMRQLSFQVNDIATGLLSGQSPFQVMAQQGGQVYQVLQMGPNGVGGSLAAIKAQILGLITPTRLLVAGFAGIAAVIAGGAISALSYAKSLDDLSRVTGIAAEKLEGLQRAAALKGIGGDTLNAGLSAFTQQIDDARLKTNDLGKLFALNGETIKRDMAGNLETVARLIKNAENDLDKLRIAQAAGFERTAETLRLFEEIGSTGVKSVEGVGAAIDKDLVQRAREFTENWALAWAEFKTGSQSAIISAAGGLQGLIDGATDLFLRISGRELDPTSRIRRGFGAVGAGSTDAAAKKALEDYAKELRKTLGVEEQLTTKVNIYGDAAAKAAGKGKKAFTDHATSVDHVVDLLGDLNDAGKNFASSFIQGIIDGKKAVDALASSLKSVGSSLLNKGLDQLWDSILPKNGAGGGVLGGAAGGISSSLGPAKPKVSNDNQRNSEHERDKLRQAA